MPPFIKFLITVLTLLSLTPKADFTILTSARFEPKRSANGMVVTSHYLATDAAVKILENGGNAMDAAVVAGFVLAVVQPRSGNIGGGGFMLYSPAHGEPYALDYRETAPARAQATMFLDEDGKVDTQKSRFSVFAAGVPGTVAGLVAALEQSGTISLKQALQPAITLAKHGFILPPRFVEGIQHAESRLKRHPASRKFFFKADGTAYQVGERFHQPELAETLQRIAEHGIHDFYFGKTAKLFIDEIQRQGGLMTQDDLYGYRVKIRKPVHGKYRGYDIYSMAPPSSGGTHIIQLLNILEHFPIGKQGHNSAQTIQQMVEAMKYAYADRAEHLGDPDFTPVPVKQLTDKAYAKSIADKIKNGTLTPSTAIYHGVFESPETTHFSIVDRHGNMVANTTTINFSYGSGIAVTGAGFLLNNEMDDFSAKLGEPNAYGLIGGKANAIAPWKRMLSSMSPTIVKHKGKNFLATGSPGGSQIISTTLQVIMNVIDHGMNIQEAVAAPRFHHQWLPDTLLLESGFSPDTQALLLEKGYTLKPSRAMGAANSVLYQDGMFYAGTDYRRSTAKAAAPLLH
jgi:gamma-glutamyltranspeptidase / glutathione hydrolase